MFDNTNHYALRTEVSEGIERYYVAFKDGQGVQNETEVSRPVYLEFRRFVKRERNLRRSDERHSEQSEISEAKLHERTLHTEKSLEELVHENMLREQLQRILNELPEIQKRRFRLYRELGMTFQQIADMEGCTKRAVKFSVDLAEEKIKAKLHF